MAAPSTEPWDELRDGEGNPRPAAAEILGGKPSLRVLEHTEQRAPAETDLDYRRVLGGLLVQSRDRGIPGRDWMKVVCGEVGAAQWDDLLFALRVVKHVTSNAIVVARFGQTLGVGAGQMSRVDAVRIAIDKAYQRNKGYGFVSFNDVHSAVEAVRRMDGYQAAPNKKLKVAIKQNEEEHVAHLLRNNAPVGAAGGMMGGMEPGFNSAISSASPHMHQAQMHQPGGPNIGGYPPTE